jgi:hypothetical protein
VSRGLGPCKKSPPPDPWLAWYSCIHSPKALGPCTRCQSTFGNCPCGVAARVIQNQDAHKNGCACIPSFIYGCVSPFMDQLAAAWSVMDDFGERNAKNGCERIHVYLWSIRACLWMAHAARAINNLLRNSKPYFSWSASESFRPARPCGKNSGFVITRDHTALYRDQSLDTEKPQGWPLSLSLSMNGARFAIAIVGQLPPEVSNSSHVFA